MQKLIKQLSATKYLGSPEVVGAIVADYCLFARDMIVAQARGGLSAEKFMAEVNAERDRLAVIFQGKNPEYLGVVGWHDNMLGFRLRVVLGSYWQQNRAANDGCPYKALFSYLCWSVFDAMQKSRGDQDMEAHVLSETTGKIIRALLRNEPKIN